MYRVCVCVFIFHIISALSQSGRAARNASANVCLHALLVALCESFSVYLDLIHPGIPVEKQVEDLTKPVLTGLCVCSLAVSIVHPEGS